MIEFHSKFSYGCIRVSSKQSYQKSQNYITVYYFYPFLQVIKVPKSEFIQSCIYDISTWHKLNIFA